MKAALKRLIGGLGYELRNTRQDLAPLRDRPRRLQFQDAICRLMHEAGPALNFLQVGAYDGLTADPLHPFIDRYRWSGVLLEPQPGPAEKLRALHAGNPRIRIVQAAAGESRGEMTLYTVDGAQDWTGGMASSSRGNIAKHAALSPGLEARIRPITVPTLTFDEILADSPLLDLLQIDTEGADARLLALFPFERMRPALVHWEIKHLPWPERRACLSRLSQFGYRFAPSGEEDMLAVLEMS